MNHEALCHWLITIPARTFKHLQSGMGLILRCWVAWQFLKSGWLKVDSWDTTLFLFAEEYRVPLLSPTLAARAGTAGELLFSALVAIGLCGRLSAVALSAVNVMAVYAYAHVLLSEGFEAALAQHVLWGMMLMVVVIYGPGQISVDHLLTRPRRANRIIVPEAEGLTV